MGEQRGGRVLGRFAAAAAHLCTRSDEPSAKFSQLRKVGCGPWIHQNIRTAAYDTHGSPIAFPPAPLARLSGCGGFFWAGIVLHWYCTLVLPPPRLRVKLWLPHTRSIQPTTPTHPPATHRQPRVHHRHRAQPHRLARRLLHRPAARCAGGGAVWGHPRAARGALLLRPADHGPRRQHRQPGGHDGDPGARAQADQQPGRGAGGAQGGGRGLHDGRDPGARNPGLLVHLVGHLAASGGGGRRRAAGEWAGLHSIGLAPVELAVLGGWHRWQRFLLPWSINNARPPTHSNQPSSSSPCGPTAWVRFWRCWPTAWNLILLSPPFPSWPPSWTQPWVLLVVHSAFVNAGADCWLSWTALLKLTASDHPNRCTTLVDTPTSTSYTQYRDLCCTSTLPSSSFQLNRCRDCRTLLFS